MPSCDNIPKEYWIPHTTQPPKIIYWNWSEDSKQTQWTAVLILKTKSENWFYISSSSEHIQPLHSTFKVSRYFLRACPMVLSIRASLISAPCQSRKEGPYCAFPARESMSCCLCCHIPWKQKSTHLFRSA